MFIGLGSWRKPKQAAVEIEIVHRSRLDKLVFDKSNFSYVSHSQKFAVDPVAELNRVFEIYFFFNSVKASVVEMHPVVGVFNSFAKSVVERREVLVLVPSAEKLEF